MDLTRIAISIVGDASHYLRAMNQVVRETQRAVRVITANLTGSAGAGLLAGLTLAPLVISANLATTAIERTLHSVTRLGSEAIEIGVNFERSQIAFSVLVGDIEKGRDLFRELTQLAIRNPFTTQQMLQGAQTLLGMGADPGHIISQLSRLSDISAGDPEKLRRLTYDFGEVLAYNRLDSRFMRAFATVGVGVKDFAETAKMSMGEFKAAMHAGEIGADVMIGTINRLTSAGGRFFDMNRTQMKTVAGAWSNVVETVQLLAGTTMVRIFERTGLSAGLTEFANSIRELGSNGSLDKIVNWIGEFSDHLAPAKADIIVIRDMFVGMANKMGMTGADFGDAFVRTLTEAIILSKELAIRIELINAHLKSFRKENLPKDHPLVQLDNALLKVNKFVEGFKLSDMSLDPANDTSVRAAKQQMDRARQMAEMAVELKKYGVEIEFPGKGWTEDQKFKYMSETLAEKQGLMTGKFISPKDAEYRMSPAGKIDKEIADLRRQLEEVRPKTLAEIATAQESLANKKIEAQSLKLYQTIFGGGVHRDPNVPTPATISADASAYAVKMIGEMKKGTTPFDKFNEQMNLATEAYLGPMMGKRTPFLGFDDLSKFRPGAELNEKQRDYAFAKNYMELAHSIRHATENSMPRAMLKDTAEAQDTVNRSNQEQLTVQQQMARDLAIAADMATQERDWLATIAGILSGQRRDGPAVVGGGNKQ